MKHYSVLTLFSLLLVGCNSTKMSEDAKLSSVVISEKAAIAVEAQQNYLALVTEDKRLRAEKQTALDEDLVDVDFIGKPIPLIEGFATRYGYTFIETGKKKDIRIINVRMRNTSPIEVLRNVGNQIDYAANLVLDKNAKTIRIIYK